MTEFDGVVPALARALSARGYETLTPVQLAVLAPELKEADMLVSAQTGSGKTVAFGLAIAPTLLGEQEGFGRADAPLALAIAPTRELALQVKRELEWLYGAAGARVTSCVGGMDMREERRALSRGVHIVVGTPGRLVDHINRGSFDTSSLRAVVLDEADEMLDLGFREDLELILGAAPEDRRTLMFSATVPKSIATLAQKYQRNAVRVATQSEQKQHVDIDYKALPIAQNDQENAIINVLRYYEAKNALVFCATRATVNHMTARLNNRGFSVVALSGELSQNERSHALQAMRDGRARVCVATDVAARGIDLPNLELVVHADVPKSRESLLHRSGRTGRAGRKGVSVLIVPQRARARTQRLLRSADVEATWENPPSVEDILRRDDARILEDTSLITAMAEGELEFAQKLLDQHDPIQIAAAFIRSFRKGKSAPEELQAPGKENAPKRREDFASSVWFSLSVGRNQQAEPRWILPAVIKAGRIDKQDIGQISIQDNESFFQLTEKAATQFMKALGSDMTIEKTMKVARLEGKFDAPKDTRVKSFKKKPRTDGPGKFERPERRERPQAEPYKADKYPKSDPREEDTGPPKKKRSAKTIAARKAKKERKKEAKRKPA